MTKNNVKINNIGKTLYGGAIALVTVNTTQASIVFALSIILILISLRGNEGVAYLQKFFTELSYGLIAGAIIGFIQTEFVAMAASILFAFAFSRASTCLEEYSITKTT